MKKFNLLFIFLIVMLFGNHVSLAQISINNNGTNPDTSAMLDVQSTTKGMLVPRMSTSQRTSVSAPAQGLLVYDTNSNSFWYFNGIEWIDMAAATSSGSGGGGCPDPEMQTCPTMFSITTPGTMVYSDCVQYCENLTEGGFSDWRTPTLDEMLHLLPQMQSEPGDAWTTTRWTVQSNGVIQFYAVTKSTGYPSATFANTSRKCQCVR